MNPLAFSKNCSRKRVFHHKHPNQKHTVGGNPNLKTTIKMLDSFNPNLKRPVDAALKSIRTSTRFATQQRSRVLRAPTRPTSFPKRPFAGTKASAAWSACGVWSIQGHELRFCRGFEGKARGGIRRPWFFIVRPADVSLYLLGGRSEVNCKSGSGGGKGTILN